MHNSLIAALTNQLQVPLVVSDILTGQDRDECTIYALNSMISDMQPDEAILAIALSMRYIIAPYLKASPSLQVTEVECMRLIEDYSQSLAECPLSAMDDQVLAMPVLEDLVDDLDYMLELLALNMNFLQAKDATAIELCTLLKAQVESHKMIAEQAVQMIEMLESQVVLPRNDASYEPVDNIVLFPVHA